MGESRPDSADADPARLDKLSPLQRAWVAYRRHTGSCARCREKGSGRCGEADQLLKLHSDLCDAAYIALAAARDRSCP